MKRLSNFLSLFFAVLMVTMLIAGCGGGGGGSSTTTTTPTNDDSTNDNTNSTPKITVSGTMNTVTAARASGAVLGNTSVIAYLAGDTTKALLNSQADVTGGDGSFSIEMEKSVVSSKDIIIEAVVASGSTSNVMIAIQGLAADQSNLSGNTSTTRKALLYHYAKGYTADEDISGVSLSTTITNIDNIFANEDIDLRTYIRDSDYSTAASRAASLITRMNSVMTACSVTSATLDSTKKSCLADELGRTVAVYGTSDNVKTMLAALEGEYRDALGLADVSYIGLTGQMLYEQTASRIASAAVGVQNATLKVYRVGDSLKTLLNSSADTTDTQGNFEVAVSLGTSVSIDVIIEAVVGTDDTNNILLAVENLSSAKTGLVGDEDTTRKALMFHFSPGDSYATTITIIDELFTDKGFDLRDYIVGSSFADSSSLTSDLFEIMKPVISTCGISSSTLTDTNKNCIQSAITSELSGASIDDSIEQVLLNLKLEYRIDLGIDSSADYLQSVDLKDGTMDQDWNAIDTLAAIFDEVENTKLSVITTESELSEILTVMSDPITAWSASYSSDIAKHVVIKDYLMELYAGESIVYGDVKTAMNNLRVDPDNGYIQDISVEAAAMASQISSTEMITVVSQYDNIRAMLIDILVNDVGETRENSSAGVEAFLEVLAALGESSENTSSMGQVLDNWVVTWDDATVTANLMTALAPLDMDDSTKTEDLMRLAHDLGDLPEGATDAQIEDVLNDYLTQDTTDVAMDIYDKYRTQTCDVNDYVAVGSPINLNLSPSQDCVSKEDIMLLMETHYEKELPKLEAFIDGFEAYMEDSNNSLMLIGMYNAFAEEGSAFQTVYASMKSSSAAKDAIGTALDAAGVKKELFWLAMNLEPYLAQ